MSHGILEAASEDGCHCCSTHHKGENNVEGVMIDVLVEEDKESILHKWWEILGRNNTKLKHKLDRNTKMTRIKMLLSTKGANSTHPHRVSGKNPERYACCQIN